MPLREQIPTSLILSIAALALAVLAGAAIVFSGGGGGNVDTLRWTPPAPTTAAAALPPTATSALAPTRVVIATAEPTASATPTRIRPLAMSAPAATPAQTTTPTAVPVARIARGPANLRSGPARDFDVARVASEGEMYEATGQTEDGAWLRLCCVSEASVWVAGELVELPAGASVPVVK
jgi:hypothetical protein